jgi:hypothetical protein
MQSQGEVDKPEQQNFWLKLVSPLESRLEGQVGRKGSRGSQMERKVLAVWVEPHAAGKD